MTAFHARYTLLLLLTATLAVLLWHRGILTALYAEDRTWVTAGISGMFGLGLLMLSLNPTTIIWHAARDAWVDRICRILPILGLLGTVVGLKIALGGVSLDDVDMLQLGVDTALNTTIAGLVGSVWLRVGRWLVR